MKKYVFLFATLLSVGVSMPTSVVLADEPTTEQTKPTTTYSVTPIVSEHQRKDTFGYFDMDWTPGQEGEIGLTIENPADEDKEYTINVNKALTNMNGALVYDDDSQNKKGTAPAVESLFSFPETVKVKAHDKTTVRTKYKLPDENIVGTKMAGVLVSEKGAAADSGVGMTYNFAFPIILRGDKQPPVDIKFGDFKFIHDKKTGLDNLVTPFTNKNENYIRHGKVDVSLKDKSGKEVFGYNLDDVIFSPETEIPFTTNPTDIAAGKYTVELKVHDGDKEWTKSGEVEVEEVDNSVNTEIGKTRGGGSKDSEVSDKRSSQNIVIGVLAAAVIALGAALGLVSKKKKEEDKANKVNKED